MLFENASYKPLSIDDLLICSFGYEPRSLYLFEENIATRNSNNTLVFQEHDTRLSKELKEKGINVVPCEYNDAEKCIRAIESFLQKRGAKDSKLSIHIDYSFMPRSWYCSLPPHLAEAYNKSNIYYWYIAGDYPSFKNTFPSAGIDNISVFTGNALPMIDKKRFHLLGLSFDSIRTETVKSIIEPDSLLACYAYNPQNPKIEELVRRLNKSTIENSLLTIALPLHDFSGMLQKISDVLYEQAQIDSQIIIVPDGPKPLILAMSLIPFVIDLPGITCLHISHNNMHYKKVAVKPRVGEIFGFTLHNE